MKICFFSYPNGNSLWKCLRRKGCLVVVHVHTEWTVEHFFFLKETNNPSCCTLKSYSIDCIPETFTPMMTLWTWMNLLCFWLCKREQGEEGNKSQISCKTFLFFIVFKDHLIPPCMLQIVDLCAPFLFKWAFPVASTLILQFFISS